MTLTIPTQLKFKQDLPDVIGNVDYTILKNKLERISEILISSGIEDTIMQYVIEEKVSAIKKEMAKPEEFIGLNYKEQVRLQQTAIKALRCMIAKSLLCESYRKFSVHLADSSLLQRFCQMDTFGQIKVPSKSVIQRYEQMFPEDKLREIICGLNITASIITPQQEDSKQILGLEKAVELDDYYIDSTCVKSNIQFPVDWVLLRDAVRTLMVSVEWIRSLAHLWVLRNKYLVIKNLDDSKASFFLLKQYMKIKRDRKIQFLGQALINQKLEEIDYEIQEMEQLYENDGKNLDTKIAYTHKYDENLLKKTISDLKYQIETEQDDLAESLLPIIPLICNPNLINNAISELKKITESRNIAQLELIKDYAKNLPEQIFYRLPESTPPITISQKEFYARRLKNAINAYIPEPQMQHDTILYLDINRSRKLLTTFESFVRDENERLKYSKELKNIYGKKSNLYELEKKLHDVSNFSEEEQNDILQLQKRREERIQKIRNLEQEKGGLGLKVKDYNVKINKLEQLISIQYEKIESSKEARRKTDKIRKVINLFNDFKYGLKTQYTKKIEDSINIKFKKLMDSNNQIKHISVDDNFEISYKDVNNENIGSGNLSAGTKQLLAISLLWSLKDVSGKNIPVVIDTPIARIDFQHQINILRNYFPQAGKQVIILPTDSEIDKNKYSILHPYIYREFCLTNPEGNETSIIEKSMYN